MGRQGGGRGNNDWQEKNAAEQRALTVVEPPRMPLPVEAAQQGITEPRWRALVDAVFPSAKTVNGVLLALDYCKARNLDPFKRVVHVVPMWNSKLRREVETVWPGIGELRTTASRTGQHAGNDDCQFGRILRQSFRDSRSGSGNDGPYSTEASCPEMDFPEWAQITVYKVVGGLRVPFVGPKVYFVETFSGEKGLRVPNARWRQAPRQMLEKCAEAAALRRAFPEELGDQYAAEEMEGKPVPTVVTAEAQYHYVSDEEAQGGEQQDRQHEQAGGQQQQDQREAEQVKPRELNGWKAEKLDRYMATMRDFYAGVSSLDTLDQVVEDERRVVETLPPAERQKAKDLEAIARARLDPGDSDGGDDDGQDHQQDRGTETQNDAAQPVEPEEPAFVRNFRRRVDEIELIADLDSLERTEKRAIDAQPGGVARECDRIIAEKRTALQAK